MKQLIILAGGKGTRLQERLGDLPKPLIDIAGKPLLERQILLAKQHGFADIILTTCYQAQKLREFCGDGSQWSVKIRYLEEKKPLGTAGAILANLDHLADTFLIMHGDTMLNVDLSAFFNFHRTHQAEISLLLHPNDHPHDSDLVQIDDHSRIVAFHPYPHPADQYLANLVNAALYVAEKKALTSWTALFKRDPIDFTRDLFPPMIKNHQFLLGYHSTEYIKDVGTPKRIDQVCADFRSGKIERRTLNTPKSAIFIDRDGTLTEAIHDVASKDQLTLIKDAALGIKRINQSGSLAVLITNQPVIARGNCSEETLKNIHHKLEGLLGQEGAFLDAIYYCPHHPDKGFPGERSDLKISCECRKPNIGMIKQAQQLTTIDLKQSWFIGDASLDMQTAKNAKIKSILVRTGYSGCDDKYAARPDFECYDFRAAVNFIFDKFPMLIERARLRTMQIKPGDRVIIGGLARSGKSTWASLMKIALAERNIDATIISLDGWLKDINQRGNGDVLSRHDIAALNRFIAEIQNSAAPMVVQVPSYNRLNRKPNKNLETLGLHSQQVIIFEGVVAFLIENLLDLAQHQFYIKTSDMVRIENFRKEYQLRGLSESEITALYQKREEDENRLIKASLTSPNMVCIEETEN